VTRDIARTLLPEGYRALKNACLKFFLGLGQKKCCRNPTTRIGQKESKLGHDRPDKVCPCPDFHTLNVRVAGFFPLWVEKFARAGLAATAVLPAHRATARQGVLISLRLAVRSTETGRVGDRVPPRSHSKKHGSQPASTRMFLDPKIIIKGTRQGHPENTSGRHEMCRPGTGENWEFGRVWHQQQLLRHRPESRFVVRKTNLSLM